MAKFLILYSTTDGHTHNICRRITEVISEAGHDIDLLPLKDNPDIDLSPYDKVILGASIRYGKHQPEVFAFAERNLDLLNQKDNAFFTVNIVARKPDKNRPDTNPYMKKFLTLTPWRPKHLEVFAGRLDYPSINWRDRQIIRFIMWMTKGPTAPDTIVEYTDWENVKAFAKTMANTSPS